MASQSDIEITKAKSVKPFVLEEEVSLERNDESWVEGLPKQYIPRWLNADSLANSRKGIWKVVDKTHPDFSKLKVARDDTPDSTVITRGDLVLAVTHKDTFKKVRLQHLNTIKSRVKMFDKKADETLEKVAKDGVKAIDGILKGISEEESDIDSVEN